ncbi:MAG: UDP-3-O-acyl-N-acetylglucosamine deacetylase [Pseudomonadota bacterium]
MGTDLRAYQTTVATDIHLSGVGVHSGQPSNITLRPAEPNVGVVFRRKMSGGRIAEIPARVFEVGATDLCTVLGDPRGDFIGTVEHIMAAFSALGLDNVYVDVDCHEVPIMDGSARVFIEAVDEVGLRYHLVKRQYIRVTDVVRVELGGSWAEFSPHHGTRYEVTIDFATPLIGQQSFKGEVNGATFRQHLANARTFGFMKDVEMLWASGHALGSSLENSVVISDDHTVINREGLRFSDEFVRHKTLDAVGDLALAGAQFIGCFKSYRGGHRLNSAALKALLNNRAAYEIVESLEERDHGVPSQFVPVAAQAYAPWAV